MSEPAENKERVVLRPEGDLLASSATDPKGQLKGLLAGGVSETVIDRTEAVWP